MARRVGAGCVFASIPNRSGLVTGASQKLRCRERDARGLGLSICLLFVGLRPVGQSLVWVGLFTQILTAALSTNLEVAEAGNEDDQRSYREKCFWFTAAWSSTLAQASFPGPFAVRTSASDQFGALCMPTLCLSNLARVIRKSVTVVDYKW